MPHQPTIPDIPAEDDLKMLIRRAWLDMMKAREQRDRPRDLRAERRMNALLGRLSALDAAPTGPRTYG